MNAARYFCFLILLPYTVGYSPDDSTSYDEYAFGFGGGQFVQRDCSGTYERSFVDAAARVTHKFDAPFRIGAIAFVGQGGRNNSTFGFIYPDLAFDLRNFSLGTTGLRIGAIDRYFFEVAALDQPPLYSGIGAIRSGIGIANIPPFSRVWIGTNILPYTKLGLATQVEFPVKQKEYLFVNGRYGVYLDRPEYGLSVGFRIKE